MGPSADWLASTALFTGLEQHVLHDLAASMKPVVVKASEILFQQGDEAERLYVVVDGRIRTSFTGRHGLQIDEHVTGDTVKDEAFLPRLPRRRTARAVRDTTLVSLARHDFEHLAAAHPRPILHIYERLGATAEAGAVRPVPAPRVIAVVGDAPPDLAEGFFAHFQASLSRFGPARRDRSHTGSGRPELVLEIKDANGFLIYDAVGGSAERVQACVSNADVIIVLADASGHPSPGARPIVPKRTMAPADRHLMLLYRNRGQRRATHDWLESSDANRHHHVSLDSATDMERVVRMLVGRPVSLVLGGGGARAFAHIGVLRAFRDLQIPIDAIGGASMGAFIAAQHAMGMTPEAMLDLNRTVSSNRLFELSVSTAALCSDTQMGRVLDDMFADIYIEDLRTPFFCVSTNLTRADVAVHWDGPLAYWLRAGMLVPGVTPPMVHNGELLVDAGLVDNLPVGVMRKFCDGYVIAVDVGREIELAGDAHEGATASFFRRIGWRRRRYPNILQIVSRAATLSNAQSMASSRTASDVYLRPPVDTVTLFNWSSIDTLEEAAYQYAMTELQERRLPAFDQSFSNQL